MRTAYLVIQLESPHTDAKHQRLPEYLADWLLDWGAQNINVSPLLTDEQLAQTNNKTNNNET